MNDAVAERFWSKVSDPDANGCRHFLGAHKHGYGWTWFNGRPNVASRVAWMLVYGPIPDGMCVCHTCDVRSCCEPTHLFLGTRGQNNKDKTAKGRQARGESWRGRRGASHYKAKHTEDDIRTMRDLHENGVSQADIARRYGLSKSTVNRIVKRLSWAHVY